MIFYFTATGNSFYVAKELCENPVSIPQELKKNKLCYTNEEIGIVAPVFAGELPKTVCEFIKKATFKTDYFYFVLTYGNDDTVSAEWSSKLASSCGIKTAYVGTVKMVDNYLPGFDMEEQKKIDKNIPAQIEKIKADIESKKHYIPKANFKGKMLYKMVQKMYKSNPSMHNGEMLNFTDKCIGCGICESVCPVGNIVITDGKAKRTNTCDFCLACIHACPHNAIDLGGKEKNPNARYRNENISLEEIIKANNQKEN